MKKGLLVCVAIILLLSSATIGALVNQVRDAMGDVPPKSLAETDYLDEYQQAYLQGDSYLHLNTDSHGFAVSATVYTTTTGTVDVKTQLVLSAKGEELKIDIKEH